MDDGPTIDRVKYNRPSKSKRAEWINEHVSSNCCGFLKRLSGISDQFATNEMDSTYRESLRYTYWTPELHPKIAENPPKQLPAPIAVDCKLTMVRICHPIIRQFEIIHAAAFDFAERHRWKIYGT